VPAIIAELDALDDLRELERLFTLVWGRDGNPPINSDILTALAHSRNYLAGARDGSRLVGGLVGWLGGRPPNELLLHSHILGVLPDHQASGLGFDLKQHQRQWCLARGVNVVEWTTDPLVRRNAYFNLTKLGAAAPEYLVNVYGEMTDGINVGEESDRLLIRWQLGSAAAVSAAAGKAQELDVADMIRDGKSVVLSVGTGGEPVARPSSNAVILCQVPDDIVALRRTDPALARAWRLAVRAALGDALAAGYRVSGATKSGWYVLELQR
jgi:predicted GNAT superfamily acetyltransferase